MTRDPSQITNDPALHLAAGIVAQGIEDYRAADVLRSLDALAWFLDDFGAAFLMDGLGMTSDLDQIFMRLNDYAKTVTNCET